MASAGLVTREKFVTALERAQGNDLPITPVFEIGCCRSRAVTLACHVLSHSVHRPRSKLEGKIEQTVVAQLVGAVLGRPRGWFLAGATVAVHGSTKLNATFHSIVREASHNASDTLSRRFRQFLLLSPGQDGPPLYLRSSSLVYQRVCARRDRTEHPGGIAAIVNPAAGRGRATARWDGIAARLAASGLCSSSFQTTDRFDATRLTREAISDGFHTIVAVGGDGTVHEVVNGFLENGRIRDDVRLAFVPAGTGMDFARNAGLGRRIDTLTGRIIAGRERRLDVGVSELPTVRAFVNFAETGLGAAVVARQARMSGAWPGRMAFLLAALAASVQEQNVTALVAVDGKQVYEGPLVSVVIANGRYFGGGMKIAPRASMEDGVFDVLILGDFSRAELVSHIWKLYPGSHLRLRKVLFFQGNRVEVIPATHATLDLDGELEGDGPYSFRVMPHSLRVVV